MASELYKRVRLRAFLPEGTFLRDYIDTMQQLETAERYDFFSALWLLSSVLGRGCVLARPSSPLFLNLYAMIVSDPGTGRKSTAVNHALNLLNTYITKSDYYADIITARANTEGISEVLVNQISERGTCNVAFCASELVNLLGKKGYAHDVPALLTELYDCPSITTGRSTSTTGVQQLKDVYSTFYAACAPSWLVRSINTDALEGGFASRLLIVSEERGKGLFPWPSDDLPMAAFYDRALSRLDNIRTTAHGLGSIGINSGARELYGTWYRNRSLYTDPYRAGFQAREHDHVLRVASLLCINDESYIIAVMHIRAAIRVVGECLNDGYRTFGGLVSVRDIHAPSAGSRDDTLIGTVSLIRRILIQAGGDWTPQASLTLKLSKRIKALGLINILTAMQNARLVQHVIEEATDRGRPARLWRGTSLLLDTSPDQIAAMVDLSRQG